MEKEEKALKCVICGGKLEMRKTDLAFEYEGEPILMKGISAYICTQCGEVYLPKKSDEQLEKFLSRIDKGEVAPSELMVYVGEFSSS